MIYDYQTHPGHRTPGAACTAARAVNAPNTRVAYLLRPSDGRYLPVVVLRADQAFMRERTAERGVLVVVEPAPFRTEEAS